MHSLTANLQISITHKWTRTLVSFATRDWHCNRQTQMAREKQWFLTATYSVQQNVSRLKTGDRSRYRHSNLEETTVFANRLPHNFWNESHRRLLNITVLLICSFLLVTNRDHLHCINFPKIRLQNSEHVRLGINDILVKVAQYGTRMNCYVLTTAPRAGNYWNSFAIL